ncbi:MAG: DUF3306 domain-containing protein [Burkholderiaceae bacterium]
MSDGEGFLSRWSKRKMGREAPVRPDEAAASPAGLPPATPPGCTAAPLAQADATLAPATAPPEAPALPNLDDVAKLTRESDYSPYVNRQVDPQVRNAAMKKLFSDPHFNVMDGLDTYIDDYGKPDPLPLAMLRQMTSARALGLFADEEAAEAKVLAAAQAAEPLSPQTALPAGAAKASPDGAPPPVLAQSAPDEIEPAHEDSDLRLQPDDAAGWRGPDEGPGPPG